MKNRLVVLTLISSFCLFAKARTISYDVADFGLTPSAQTGKKINNSPLFIKMMERIKKEKKASDKVVIKFSDSRYDFYPEGASSRVYYISNHDQDNPKTVGMAIEQIDNLTLDGDGAKFVFHGRMLPVSVVSSKNATLKNFSVDFDEPQITQIQIIDNSPTDGITFKVAPWVNYRIADNGCFEAYGDGWALQPSGGIAFEQDTKHIVYNTSDISCPTKGAIDKGNREILSPSWKDARLKEGTVVAMRTWARPNPGVFLYLNKNTTLTNIKIHFAEGMGLLAQVCENIKMDGFCVSLKGADDPRYFTTQADATHFSGCRGKIISNNGLYENMMDDAINVHGTYLKVTKRKDDHTLVARYMHSQSWGFFWGDAGDKVQFVRSETMELCGDENSIASISPLDKTSVDGAREYEITFAKPLDSAISEKEGFGIENLTWTPEVEFKGNTIRNNRARGSLFSTPKKTVVENNLFDHTSGTAILLCGDCNGWYETGACRDVLIRGNRFVNALTNMFQFTSAVISIYPEIPNLKSQKKYFHGVGKGSIRIIKNEFDTFDEPILYAKSVDGLVFKDNLIKKNTEYKPFHWNKKRVLLERVKNAEIED